MRALWTAAALAATVLWVAGCGDDDGGGGDGDDDGDGDGPFDAAAAEPDSGPGAADSGPGDPDAGPPDAGPPDAGPADAGPDDPDAGPSLAACADQADQDGDRLGGYPDDPGCSSLDDDDETDDCPDGPGCPACGNAVDDDRDLAQDYPGDIGCSDAADEDESDTCVPGLDVRPLEWGSQHVIEPGPSYVTATCDPATANNPENVHAFRVTEPIEALTFARTIYTPNFEIATSIQYGDCGDPDAELTCAVGQFTSVDEVPPGTYYVFADSITGTVGQYDYYVTGIVPRGGGCGSPAPGGDYDGRCIPSDYCDNYPAGGICRPNQCFDGIDNDGDGRVDWPDDPGCRVAYSSESDDACPASPCSACANQIDDDQDGVTDLADSDCLYAASDAELPRSCYLESDRLIQITGPNLTGTTVGAVNDEVLEYQSVCGQGDSDGGSPDLVYWIYLPGLASLRVVDNGGSFFGRIVGMGPGCDSIYDCMEYFDDDSAALPDALGYIYVVIDGANGYGGAYDFVVSGIYQAGEPCDPAHIESGIMECAEFTDCVDGVCQY